MRFCKSLNDHRGVLVFGDFLSTRKNTRNGEKRFGIEAQAERTRRHCKYVAIVAHLDNWSSVCVCVSVYLLESLNARVCVCVCVTGVHYKCVAIVAPDFFAASLPLSLNVSSDICLLDGVTHSLKITQGHYLTLDVTQQQHHSMSPLSISSYQPKCHPIPANITRVPLNVAKIQDQTLHIFSFQMHHRQIILDFFQWIKNWEPGVAGTLGPLGKLGKVHL